MHELSFHENKLLEAIKGDRERVIAFGRARGYKKRFSLPLIHQTVKDNDEGTLKSIFEAGHLQPRRSPTRREAELNLEPAVYFFYGAAAYGKGTIALVFHAETMNEDGATFSAFDSGALATPWYLEPSYDELRWSEPKFRQVFLNDHTGDCKDLAEFAVQYLNAHFADIREYVRRPMQSKPDWEPYHKLISSDGGADRRSWTIEVRIQSPVSLKKLKAIVVDRADLLHLLAFLDGMFDDRYPDLVIADEVPNSEINVEDSPQPLHAKVNEFIIKEYFGPPSSIDDPDDGAKATWNPGT